MKWAERQSLCTHLGPTHWANWPAHAGRHIVIAIGRTVRNTAAPAEARRP